MILYFADRHLNILGQASTHLRKGITVISDTKTEDLETGVAIFECDLGFNRETQLQVEEWASVGNYILRSSDNEAECFNIIDCEIDTKKQTAYIYAEDDGLDLLNDVADPYEAAEPHPISYYINLYAEGAGWEIGINEVEGLTRQLNFDTDETCNARLLKIAEAFNGCELSFSFDISGLYVKKKYINIYEKRGKDTGIQLRLNKEIDSIITTKSIANLATALKCSGGTPENAENPITLRGYEYDDGNFYVDGEVLKSRNALEKWSRYLWRNDETKQSGGHIVKPYSDESLSQAVLCENAIAELEKICDMEINYEADIKKLPEEVKIGDRVNIIDDNGELYISSRLLIIETSVTDDSRRAVLGEHLIRKSGISAKVEKLAAQFAQNTKSVARAVSVANNAAGLAEAAQTAAEAAASEALAAETAASEAQTTANTAAQAAINAKAQAEAAEAAVNAVETSVASLETTVENARAAAENAETAAETATAKAEEARAAAENAETDAAEALTASGNAQTAAETAVTKADSAESLANTAKTTAESASATAAAAKLDAEQAAEDVAAFSEELETVKTTMSAEYARKTELTETTASLQTQITQNAGQIEQTANQITVIDETANNAAALAAQSKNEAEAAQSQANEATAAATAAQTAANNAATAAQNAQNEADAAAAAAATAKSVADQAEAALTAAQEDLATVTSRVGATEEEIAAAQQAVEAAQSAAETAQANAQTAANNAATAQQTANTAVTNAATAQTKANEAATAASAAQQTANEAKGNATAAQNKANEAAQAAATAQQTAQTAVNNAATAQTKANEAAAAAATAQSKADEAAEQAAQAETDLATAQQNLAAVISRVDATAEEVAAAQAAVSTAQAKANEAAANAATAQSTADTAKANAATAQTAANTAKTAADNAQAKANEAKAAADKAQADVNALTTRVVTAETKITQNTEAITLRATKTEVTEQFNALQIGGKNLIIGTDFDGTAKRWERTASAGTEVGAHILVGAAESALNPYYISETLVAGQQYTVSMRVKGKANITLYRIATSGNSAIQWLNKSDISETEYTHHSITFEPHKEQLSGIYIVTKYGEANTLVGDWFEIEPKSLKLEKGNKASDWTPAPEEFYTTEETDAQLKVTSENITSEVSAKYATTEELNTAKSAIQQLADSIKFLVTYTDENGVEGSLMTQREDGWTFNTFDLQNAVDVTSESLEALIVDVGSVDEAVKLLQSTVDGLSERVHIGSYTYTDGTGTHTEPSIDLYEGDTEFKLKITNTRIVFTDGTTALVEINSKDKSLVIEKAEIKGELQIGGFVWKKRANGNMGLTWKGVAN